jgi:hypothetical protein
LQDELSAVLAAPGGIGPWTKEADGEGFRLHRRAFPDDASFLTLPPPDAPR